MKSKILNRQDTAEHCRKAHESGRSIVFTNGCFDILHIGHVRYLQASRNQGDLLIVGLNSDRSIRELKGPSRPIVPEEERAEVIAALECVDIVCIFDELRADNIIRAVAPDVYAKGGDLYEEIIPEAPLVRSLGGVVCIMPFVEDRSTTRIIRIIEAGALGCEQ